jgi:hypothetical protein
MRKNPHAVALGRLGGKARSAALSPTELSRIGRLGGQPRRYRLSRGTLERRDGDRWLTLEPPYDRAAREALRRLSRHHR